jgi:hypothetical protein
MREVPLLNCCSVNGTATIIVNDTPVKGVSLSRELADTNPGWSFIDSAECMMMGCAAERSYQASIHLSGTAKYGGFNFQTAISSMTTNQGLQTAGYANQHFESVDVVPLWHAKNILGLVWDHEAQYWFQPHLNSPDCGPWVQCSVTQGASGTILAALNVTDGTETPVLPAFASYETSGQSIIKRQTSYHGSALTVLSAGISTDTPSIPEENLVTYEFPVTFSGQLQQPKVAVPLADVPNATQVGYQCTYDPYYAGNLTPVKGLLTVSNGVAAGTLPIDLALRPSPTVPAAYCTFPYLDSSNNVLAPGWLQSF